MNPVRNHARASAPEEPTGRAISNGVKKKVLYIITKATWGGAQRYVYDAATHVPKGGYEATVAYGQKGHLVEKLEAFGIKTHHIPALGRDIALISDVASFFQIYRYIGTVRPDEVNLHSSKAAGLGALAARLRGVPRIVFVLHGWPFKERRNAAARALIYFVSWLTALLSNEVRVVSRTDETIGKRMWKIAQKIRYTPITLEETMFLPRAEAEAALGISSILPRIVTIAELTRNKGQHVALKAIAALKKRGVSAEYFLIGNGEDAASLAEAARKLDIEERVHFLGFRENAAEYLKAFDVFLLPSLKEGMPYVLLEAAKARLPIVTTNVVDPEFLKDNPGTIAIDPESQTAIANAIERVLHARN